MGRNKEHKEKRGRKHPEGFTKRKILLIALEHPEGIREPDLVEEIKNKLDVVDTKGIKGHLADLGDGRKIQGREKGKTCKEGKHYLIKKEPSGKEIENFWKPNPDQETQIRICIAMLKGDIEVFFHERAFHKDLITNPENKDNILLNLGNAQRALDTIRFFNTEYVQRALDTSVLPLFKKRYGIDPSVEAKIPKELTTFIESGFKMSPTAVLATLTQSHLVEVAVGMFIAALYNNTTRKLDKVAGAVITLYACLLTDMEKYCLCPGVADKIYAFLREPHFISAISAWVDWDFRGLELAPYEIEAWAEIPPIKGEG